MATALTKYLMTTCLLNPKMTLILIQNLLASLCPLLIISSSFGPYVGWNLSPLILTQPLMIFSGTSTEVTFHYCFIHCISVIPSSVLLFWMIIKYLFPNLHFLPQLLLFLTEGLVSIWVSSVHLIVNMCKT